MKPNGPYKPKTKQAATPSSHPLQDRERKQAIEFRSASGKSKGSPKGK